VARLQSRQQDLHQELQQVQNQDRALDHRRQEILHESSVSDWEQFLAGCAARERYRSISEQLERLDIQLEPYLAKRSISGWKSDMALHPLDPLDLVEPFELLEDVRKQVAESARLLQETELSLAALNADMERALTGFRELAEIQEEYAAACRKRDDLAKDAAALDTALLALEKAAEKRHRLLAPELNKRVGDVISTLTHGRYQKVRIDNDLNVTVSASEAGREVDLTALSAGTVDQFYFAVRVAMADLISQDRKLPLFMDDPFMQYSPQRLRRVLEYVSKLGQERQILLFTCRRQEQEMLDVLGVAYHLIELRV
jgi:uncharacterized protein YhaN